MRSLFIVQIILSSIVFVSPAKADLNSALHRVDFSQVQRDFVMDNQDFRGNWQDGQQWSETFCTGSYQYNILLQGHTDNVAMDLQDDGSIIVNADLSNLYFNANGNIRSEYSFCRSVNAWTGIGADSLAIQATVFFSEGGKDDLSDLKVRVNRTTFGTIRIGVDAPAWFNRLLTSLVNRAAADVWSSRLGDWISARLVVEMKKLIPPGAP